MRPTRKVKHTLTTLPHVACREQYEVVVLDASRLRLPPDEERSLRPTLSSSTEAAAEMLGMQLLTVDGRSNGGSGGLSVVPVPKQADSRETVGTEVSKL